MDGGDHEPTLGEKVINAITRQPMFRTTCRGHPESVLMTVWSAGAAEQIEALIFEHFASGKNPPD